MKEDDREAKNTIEDFGISTAHNVPENGIEEYITGTTNEDDEDDDSCAPNNDDENNLDIPIIEKAYKPLYKGS